MNALQQAPQFIILGASLDSGNMGVSALLDATVKCIRYAHPDAVISLLEGTRLPGRDELRLPDGQVLRLGRVGVRRNKAIWHRDHVVRLLCTAALLRLVPVLQWRRRLLSRNPYLHCIASAHCVVDVSGGDSFSDLYGIRRLVLGTLLKLLVLATGADLVLLPQTYGPFQGRLARALARCVLARATVVYARDRPSLDVLSDLLKCTRARAAPEFAPDVAFVLDPIAPKRVRTAPAPLPPAGEVVTVGFNVSGLLFNGGYTQRNMFGLRTDYRSLVHETARSLLRADNTAIFLVPHVFKPTGHVESDSDACREVFRTLSRESPNRVFLLDGEYDQNQIKYVIGLCDFFVGSRMHACIAAVSQCIPAAPLAYSRKFHGVFDSINVAELVVDLRTSDMNGVLDHVLAAFRRRADIADHLRREIPSIQQRALGLFLQDGQTPPCRLSAEPEPLTRIV